MVRTYRISVDHHRTYGIKGRGTYGLMIGGKTKEISSEKELGAALTSLGYRNEEVVNTLELLVDNKDFWQDTRDFDESAVAALGF
jgi:sulfur carrier protein ThiS